MFYYETKTKLKKERQYITIYDFLVQDIWENNIIQAIKINKDKYIYITEVEVLNDYEWMKIKELTQQQALTEVQKRNPLSILKEDWMIDDLYWIDYVWLL